MRKLMPLISILVVVLTFLLLPKPSNPKPQVEGVYIPSPAENPQTPEPSPTPEIDQPRIYLPKDLQ